MPKPRRPWKRRGTDPQTDKRDLYRQLVAKGTNNSAACRAVGINRRTRTRWRYGRTVTDRAGGAWTYPPITGPIQPLSDRFLSAMPRVCLVDHDDADAS